MLSFRHHNFSTVSPISVIATMLTLITAQQHRIECPAASTIRCLWSSYRFFMPLSAASTQSTGFLTTNNSSQRLTSFASSPRNRTILTPTSMTTTLSLSIRATFHTSLVTRSHQQQYETMALNPHPASLSTAARHSSLSSTNKENEDIRRSPPLLFTRRKMAHYHRHHRYFHTPLPQLPPLLSPSITIATNLRHRESPRRQSHGVILATWQLYNHCSAGFLQTFMGYTNAKGRADDECLSMMSIFVSSLH